MMSLEFGSFHKTTTEAKSMDFSHRQGFCWPIWLHSLCTNEQMISPLGRDSPAGKQLGKQMEPL